MKFTPISKLLEPGLSVIGSCEEMFRHAFQDQLANDIAKLGGRVFGFFEKDDCNVLILRNGLADCNLTRERISRLNGGKDNKRVPVIQTEKRIEMSDSENASTSASGLGRQLEREMEANSNPKLIILPDFPDICTNLARYIQNETDTQRDFDAGDPRHKDFVYRRNRQNLRMLKDFCFERKVCILLGHDLNQNGKTFRYMGEMHYCNTRLFLTEKTRGKDQPIDDDHFKLEIEGNSIGKVSYQLVFNNFLGFHFSREEMQKMNTVGLTGKDIEIIDTLWDSDGMTFLELVAAGFIKSTLNARFKDLIPKGWVHKVDNLYVADKGKHRPWRNES